MAKNTPPAANTDKNGQGGTMPLFYKNPVPLDAKAHAQLALKKNFGLGFTKGVNAVPVNLKREEIVMEGLPGLVLR